MPPEAMGAGGSAPGPPPTGAGGPPPPPEVPPEAAPGGSPSAGAAGGGTPPGGHPPYMGFLQMFKREYGDAPPEAMKAAEDFWAAFDKYVSKPGGGWHELAQNFSYADYIHDVVLVIAARHGDSKAAETEKAAPAQKEKRG